MQVPAFLAAVPGAMAGSGAKHVVISASPGGGINGVRGGGKGGSTAALERVNVMCNGVKAQFMIHTQTIVCRCPTCTESGAQGSRAMSPTEFERHSGMQASKKWRRSIKVDLGQGAGTMSLGRWLEQNGFKSSTPAGMTPPVVMQGAGGGLPMVVGGILPGAAALGGIMPLQSALLQQQMAGMAGLQGLPPGHPMAAAAAYAGLMGMPVPSMAAAVAAAAVAGGGGTPGAAAVQRSNGQHPLLPSNSSPLSAHKLQSMSNGGGKALTPPPTTAAADAVTRCQRCICLCYYSAAAAVGYSPCLTWPREWE